MPKKKATRKSTGGARKEAHVDNRDPDRLYYVKGNGDVMSKPRGKRTSKKGGKKKFKGSGPQGHRVLTCKRGCKKK